MTTKKSKESTELEYQLLGGPLTFGQAIEGLRKSNDLSQSALARKMGFSRQYLCDIEKRRRMVSPSQAARFAKAFGHPPIVLVQIALQDSVRESGLRLKVTVQAA